MPKQVWWIIGVVILLIVGYLVIKNPTRSSPQVEGVSTETSSTATTTVISVDGSSTVFPITEAAAEDFEKTDSNVKVTVGISGTGGGFKKFCAGEIDISDASRPIKSSEIEACKEKNVEFIELPVAFDGIAVMVNPRNTWVDRLSVAELKKMWEPEAQGKVLKWSDVRAGWPNKELHLYGPGADSGTFDYFTEAIVGKEDSSRGDFTASEDDNVLVQGITNDENALGFFGVAYYEQNKDKLKLIPIDGVLPSATTIIDGTYQPLSRPLFVYVSKTAADKPEVDRFMKYYLQQASRLVPEVGYIGLPGNSYRLAEEKFVKRTSGSIFIGGSQVGVKIEDILK